MDIIYSPEDGLQLLVAKAQRDIFEIREFAKKHNLLNSQTYINFEDLLNTFSTMDPNA